MRREQRPGARVAICVSCVRSPVRILLWAFTARQAGSPGGKDTLSDGRCEEEQGSGRVGTSADRPTIPGGKEIGIPEQWRFTPTEAAHREGANSSMRPRMQPFPTNGAAQVSEGSLYERGAILVRRGGPFLGAPPLTGPFMPAILDGPFPRLRITRTAEERSEPSDRMGSGPHARTSDAVAVEEPKAAVPAKVAV